MRRRLLFIDEEVSILDMLINLFALVMKARGCAFPFFPCTFSALASALALGSVGFLAAAVSGSVIAGYFLSAGYYLLNLLGSIDTSSKLCLFSMSEGDFAAKYWLAAIGASCCVLVLAYEKLRQR